MGAGKTTIIRSLAAAGELDLKRFILVESEQIKAAIPEYGPLAGIEPRWAADAVHPEAAQIQRLIIWRALSIGKNILVDGSLRHADYFRRLIGTVRKNFPQYTISIVFVDAGEATIMERVKRRSERIGRMVPNSVLQDALAKVKLSFKSLGELVDVTIEIENEAKPVITHIRNRGLDLHPNREIPLVLSNAAT